ncbi:MAG: hypothetical protein ACRC62_30125 [Microcoleus sp.]
MELERDRAIEQRFFECCKEKAKLENAFLEGDEELGGDLGDAA